MVKPQAEALSWHLIKLLLLVIFLHTTVLLRLTGQKVGMNFL